MFVASLPPSIVLDDQDLIRYLYNEFQKLEDESANIRTRSIVLEESTTLPAKPEEGLVQRFSANTVAPAAARGVYEYAGGAWVKL